jgi:hypothetical protein
MSAVTFMVLGAVVVSNEDMKPQMNKDEYRWVDAAARRLIGHEIRVHLCLSVAP